MAFGPIKTDYPNIIILMTDQQRAFRYFPEKWIDRHLPNFRKLQANGLTFTHAICNASRCSPSRSVLYTGQYTWQTKVFNVGGTLSPTIPTIGKLMQTAGYQMVYKGKWHLSDEEDNQVRPTDPTLLNTAVEDMENNYQITGWNPPDAGTVGSASFSNNSHEPQRIPSTPLTSPYFAIGGSFIMNDDRYVIGPSMNVTQESAIDFLTHYQQSGASNPFCLAVSLVNPHDINVFPNLISRMKYMKDRPEWQAYKDFVLPDSYTDNLETKPTVQKTFVSSTDTDYPFDEDFTQLEYLKFYAYLHTMPDQLFSMVLGSMSQELLDNTIIIRLADHGEMGMSHGGMRFKDLNAYQETMNVPLVISNPLLFPEGQCVDQLVGLVDIMPTLASIIGLSDAQKALFSFKGIDFSPVLLNAQSPTQPSMLYTYDDGVTADEIGYIRTLVKADYKFSVYYQTADGTPTGAIQPATFQYELYNLLNDASEMNNLLPVGGIERLQTPAEAIAIANLKLQLYNELTQKMLDTQTTPNGWPAPAIA